MEHEMSNDFTTLKEFKIKQDTSDKIVIRLDESILELEKEKYLMEGQKRKNEAFIQRNH